MSGIITLGIGSPANRKAFVTTGLNVGAATVSAPTATAVPFQARPPFDSAEWLQGLYTQPPAEPHYHTRRALKWK